MNEFVEGNEELTPTALVDVDRGLTPSSSNMTDRPWSRVSWKKLWGGLLFAGGWLLSPLCWWNDLLINLPIAYGFGYLCHWIAADWHCDPDCDADRAGATVAVDRCTSLATAHIAEV